MILLFAGQRAWQYAVPVRWRVTITQNDSRTLPWLKLAWEYAVEAASSGAAEELAWTTRYIGPREGIITVTAARENGC